MVSTDDIPYLGSLLRKVTAAQDTAAAGVGPQSEAGTPVPMFDPDVVELNATMLLRFLQVSCICMLRVLLLQRVPGHPCDKGLYLFTCKAFPAPRLLFQTLRCVLATPTHALLS